MCCTLLQLLYALAGFTQYDISIRRLACVHVQGEYVAVRLKTRPALKPVARIKSGRPASKLVDRF